MAQGTSKLPRPLTSLILVGLALLTTINAWRSMVHYADLWPFAVDELTYTQAAVNFFRSVNYTSDIYSGNFQPQISTGLAASWPSAIAWAFHSNLLASRLVVGGVIWAFYLLVSWLFLRQSNLPTPLRLFLLAGTWSVGLFAIPNAPLFLMNMGELVGALWIGLGLLLMRKSPYLAAFSWGIAVWSCKFIYSPVALSLGAAWLITSPEPWPVRFRRAAILLLWFLAPLLIWLTIIWVRFDSATVLAWVQGMLGWMRASFLHWAPAESRGLDQAPNVRGLIARLTSPELEWHSYAWDWKVKILALTLGSITLSMGLLLGQPRLTPDRRSWRFALAVTGCVTAYTLWYFLWHPYMYIRHFQPALYLGLGLYLFWLWGLATRFQPFLARSQWLWLSLAVIVVGQQTINAWRTPLLQAEPTLARTCTDLFSPNCGDYTALRDRIRGISGSTVVRDGPPPNPYPVFEDSYGRVEFVVPPDCSVQTDSVLGEQLRQIAEAHNELWLLRTMPVQCDPAGFVPRWLAEHAYPAEEFWLQNNLFTRYLIAADFKAQGTNAGWLGDSISLTAWGTDKVTVAPGQALNISLTWVTASTLAQDYRVFVFLADQSEHVAALRDAVPTMWLRPTSTWQPGEPITDHHGLLIPPEAIPGDYWLGVGIYNSATGERLPVTHGNGWLNNTALRLISMTIEKP